MSLYALLGSIAGEPTPLPTPDPPEGPTLNVASWCNAINMGKLVNDRTATTATTGHSLAVDVIDPTLVWVQTAGFIGQANGATYSVTARINNGAPVPVTVAGQPTFRLDVPTSVHTITSDPVPLSAFAGDILHVTVTADADGTTGTIPSSFVGPRGALDAAQTSGFALRPTRVVAPSDRESWLAVGDSILQGTNGTNELTFPDIALGDLGVAFTKSAQGGEGWQYYPSRWAQRIGPHAAFHTHMLDQFGINDTTAAKGLAFWKYTRENSNMEIVKTTLFPVASTSDNWVTQAASSSHEPHRSVLNDWLRDGAPCSADWLTPLPALTTDPDAVRCSVVGWEGDLTSRDEGHPLVAVLDVAAALETSPGAGTYNTAAAAALASTNHGDGLHPSIAVHRIAAAWLVPAIQALGY